MNVELNTNDNRIVRATMLDESCLNIQSEYVGVWTFVNYINDHERNN